MTEAILDDLTKFFDLVLTDHDLELFRALPAAEKTQQYYAVHFSILSTLTDQDWFKNLPPHLQAWTCAKFDSMYASAFLDNVFTY